MKTFFGLLLMLFTTNSMLFAQQKDLGDGLFADVITTKGHIMIQLEFEKTPMTVANFVSLAQGKMEYDTIVIKEPFYNGLTFHRVIADFMIQGGDPLGTGSGNPGYFFPDEIDTSLKHNASGILSMANAGPNTNGSQFFITHKETPWLDGKHTIFGRVIKGQEIVDKIEQGDMIERVVILRNGKKAKKFKAHKIFPKLLAEFKAAEIEKNRVRNETFKKEMSPKYPNAKQTESGLMYEITQASDGDKPIVNKEITVHYTGYFTNGETFDSSKDRGQPFSFPLGQGRVIKGWDEGIQLGNIGSEIKLIIPYWLAYGKGGRGSIPPNSTLIFDVEIISK